MSDAMDGAWAPGPGDALHACTFARAGFRSFALRAPDGAWRLVLSRVDVGEREPRAILTVEAPGFEFVVEVPVKKEAEARGFAAKINNAAKA